MSFTAPETTRLSFSATLDVAAKKGRDGAIEENTSVIPSSRKSARPPAPKVRVSLLFWFSLPCLLKKKNFFFSGLSENANGAGTEGTEDEEGLYYHRAAGQTRKGTPAVVSEGTKGVQDVEAIPY